MKPNKPAKSGDTTDKLLRIIDVQSRVIEALAMAAGAVAAMPDDDEDKEEDE